MVVTSLSRKQVGISSVLRRNSATLDSNSLLTYSHRTFTSTVLAQVAFGTTTRTGCSKCRQLPTANLLLNRLLPMANSVSAFTRSIAIILNGSATGGKVSSSSSATLLLTAVQVVTNNALTPVQVKLFRSTLLPVKLL